VRDLVKPMRADKQTHIPSLDGIRGIAALLVFVSHAGLDDVIPGGFGVTIFFFLSGYLITTLLRQEFAKTESISLRRFYLRRVYRILPPMYIVLAILILLAWADVVPSNMELGAVAAQFVQVTNYYLILHGPSHLVPFTIPMWSLAIEEHFYLIFPVAFAFLLRHYDYRRVAAIFLVVCAAVLLWRCYLFMGLGVSWRYTYMATDTRIDSLLYGCTLGVWCNPWLDRPIPDTHRRRWILLLILSVGLLLFTFLYREPAFRETFRYSIQGIALFPIFLCAVRFHTWPIFSWLELRLVRGLGLISYTFYLCHFACLRIVEERLHATAIVRGVVAFVLAVAFSTLMYVLIERNLAAVRRRLHDTVGQRRLTQTV